MAIENSDGGDAAFWDARFAEDASLFGTAPNAFVVAEAPRIPAHAEVVELGAGAGRNLIYLAHACGCRVTAADFSAEALAAARQAAPEAGIVLETRVVDARTWQPNRRWDAAVVTFLHLLPDERPVLYRLLQQVLCPGGLLLAEWFRPAHASNDYASIGPPSAEWLVPVEELQRHFPAEGILHCEEVDVTLDEGPVLQGRAAVVQFVYRQPE